MRKNPALYDINLSISKGEFVVITGFSGSGKSTLVYSILGLIPFFYSGESSGKVLFQGEDISNLHLANHSRKLGYVSQRISNSFATPYTFSELAFPLEYSKKFNNLDIGPKIMAYSSELSIEDILVRKIHSLSEGEKQLVSFASATINNSHVIIADEPLANLDRTNRELILSKFENYHKFGATIIITAHDYESYLPLASRLIKLTAGRISEDFKIKIVEKKPIRTDYEKNLQKFKKKKYAERADDKIVEVKNLHFKYSSNFQLENISFAIERGEVIGIIGDNGSGKTTLLKLLCGLIEPQSGEISIDGKTIKNLSWNEMTRKIGVVFQDPDKQFFEETVKDEISLISENLEMKIISDEISLKLEECGLEGYENYNPHSLSFGEKRRLAFLSAIQHQPEIVLIDEITAGMDTQNKNWVHKQIVELSEMNKTLVIISHDWKWLGDIADIVYHLEKGSISTILDNDQFKNLFIEKSKDSKNLQEGK